MFVVTLLLIVDHDEDKTSAIESVLFRSISGSNRFKTRYILDNGRTYGKRDLYDGDHSSYSSRSILSESSTADSRTGVRLSERREDSVLARAGRLAQRPSCSSLVEGSPEVHPSGSQ